nr:MAG: hypothetical protein [Chemarfal virus 149]
MFCRKSRRNGGPNLLLRSVPSQSPSRSVSLRPCLPSAPISLRSFNRPFGTTSLVSPASALSPNPFPHPPSINCFLFIESSSVWTPNGTLFQVTMQQLLITLTSKPPSWFLRLSWESSVRRIKSFDNTLRKFSLNRFLSILITTRSPPYKPMDNSWVPSFPFRSFVSLISTPTSKLLNHWFRVDLFQANSPISVSPF